MVDITRDLSQVIIHNELSVYQSETAMKNIITNLNKEESVARLLETGYHMDGRYCVAQVEIVGGTRKKDEIVRKIHDFLLIRDDCMVFSLHSGTVVIYIESATENISESIQSLRAELKKCYPRASFYIGVGSNVRGIEVVSDSYRQAAHALRVARMCENPCVFYDDIGLYKLLFMVEDQTTLSQFADEILGNIMAYDKAHNTDYLEWLSLYLRYDGSIQRIAEEAFYHRNTVNYKISKMRDLFGLDTNSNEQKAAFFIALHIVKLLNK